MRFGKYEIDNFFVLVILFIVAFFFRDYLGDITLPKTVFFVVVGSYFYLLGSGYVEQAKNKTPKIVGDSFISDSVLSDVFLDIGSFRVYGLGGFRDAILGEFKQTNGVVVAHKSLVYEFDRNIVLKGETHKLSKYQLPFSWLQKIRDFYKTIPEYVYFVVPFDKKQVLPSSEEFFVKDLLVELTSISKENHFLTNTLERMGVTVDSFVDRSSGVIKSVVDSLKKPFKKVNEDDK